MPAAVATILDPAQLAKLARFLVDEASMDLMRRTLIGIAGVPGAGKSTFAQKLWERVEELDPGLAVILPMDGFHLTSRRLKQAGLLESKGSPDTFDATAYIELLRRARDASVSLVFPIYDRAKHEPVLRDEPIQRIGPATRLVITEGNYLLVDEAPWSELADVLTETWLLDTPVQKARRWILDRHEKGGRSPEQAADHYNRVDLPNAQYIMEMMREPDRRFRW